MFLEKLELQGFKTFAQKTTLEFMPPRAGKRGITAIVGPNGSGKCLNGDSRVMLADGRYVKIRDMFLRAQEKSSASETMDDGICVKENPENLEILSLNPKTLKLEKRRIGAFIKRKSPSHLLRVRTRTGKTIETTHYHPFFTLQNGRLHTLTAEELKPGIRISTPRKLPIEGAAVNFKNESILPSFTREDSVYVPWSPRLETAVRQSAQGVGTLTKLAETIGVPLQHIRMLYSRQAVQANVLAPLATSLPEIRSLKSKGTGFLKIPKTLDEKLARFLGYVISEGRVTGVGQVWFVNEDKAMIKDFCSVTKAVFGLEARRFYYKKNSEDVIAFSTTLCHFLEKIFDLTIDGHSRTKAIPAHLFGSKKQIIRAFLGALFEGDGYVSTREYRGKLTAYIEYATASKKLADDVVTLLLRLGINAICTPKQKCATNTTTKIRRTYYSVYIYGQENLQKFAAQIKFVGKKQKKLEFVKQLSAATNPNIDLIPSAVKLVREAVLKTKTKVKPLRQMSPKLAAYNERRCEASRGGVLEAVSMLRAHRTCNSGDELLTQLETLANSDVLWDEVVEVEKIKPEEWVYDLSIPETHNFVAENFIVHNSNLADAVRWVLGEQSMKLLRGKKSEDVIFTGTARRARAGFAEAALTLNNEDRSAPIDYSALEISRRLYRDGNSEYLINGKTVRLADIQLLLAQANFGQRTYSVIGQGMVDHILVASPQERKEFFDEAAGVKQFQLKRDQAVNKLERTRDNLAQAESLLNEIAPRLRSLSRQVRRLEERDPIEEELKILGRAHYGKLWRELNTSINELKKKTKELDERHKAKNEVLQGLREELAGLEAKETKAKGFLDLQKEYETLNQSRSKIREELLKVENAIAFAKLQEGKADAVPVARLLTEVERLVKEQKDFLARLEQVKNLGELAEVQQVFRDLLGGSEAMLKEFTGKSTTPARFDNQKKEFETELAKTDAALGALQRQIHEYGTEEQKKRGRLFSLQHDLQRASEAQVAIDRELNEVRVSLARFETKRESLAQEIQLQMEIMPDTLLEGDLPVLETGKEEAAEKIRKLKTQLEVIGSIDPEVIKEHSETKERHDFLKSQIDDLNKATEDLGDAISELERIIEERAEVSFKNLNREFEKYFKILFGGGTAGLTKTQPAREEEEDLETEDRKPKTKKPEYTGIEIIANPPGKRIKSINMLSGGERAMTSIAIICAIMAENPSPFVVLDEVDAALDEANSIKFAKIVEELVSQTQFIIITHNRATMEKANVLYGVTMGDDGISRLLSLRLEDVEAVRRGKKVKV